MTNGTLKATYAVHVTVSWWSTSCGHREYLGTVEVDGERGPATVCIRHRGGEEAATMDDAIAQTYAMAAEFFRAGMLPGAMRGRDD